MGAGVSFVEEAQRRQQGTGGASGASGVGGSEGGGGQNQGQTGALKGGNNTIPLSALASRIKVFQHSESGDVLILVDQHITKAGLVPDCSLWFEVQVAAAQAVYLQSLKTRVALDGGTGAAADGSIKQLPQSQSQPQTSSTHSVHAPHPASLPCDLRAQSKSEAAVAHNSEDTAQSGSGMHADDKLGSVNAGAGAFEFPSDLGGGLTLGPRAFLHTQAYHNTLYYPPPRKFSPLPSGGLMQMGPRHGEAKGGEHGGYGPGAREEAEAKDGGGHSHSTLGSSRYDSCQICGKVFDMTGISREEVS
jgi:hypothetical protein